MHELPVTRSIFHIVVKHATRAHVQQVVAVNLEVGALSDLQPEWLQRYFDRLSRGTVADGAILRVRRVPAVFYCHGCERSFEVRSLLEQDLACVRCTSTDLSMVSGRQYRVTNMEAV